MKCSKCGMELKPKDLFCKNCGSAVNAYNADDQSQSDEERTLLENSNQPTIALDPNSANEIDLSALGSGNSINNNIQVPNVPQPDWNSPPPIENKKTRASLPAIILVVVLSFMLLFVVFNALLVADVFNISEGSSIGQYRDNLQDLFNISRKGVTEQPTESTTAETTTVPETTTDKYANIPDELKPYADKLEPVGRNYVVALEYSDWKINIRSTPEYYKDRRNDIGDYPNGSTIYVEYIYDDIWVVYKYPHDGKTYAFSSICSHPDTKSGTTLLYPQ